MRSIHVILPVDVFCGRVDSTGALGIEFVGILKISHTSVTELEKVGNSLASTLAKSILDYLDNLARAHNIVCAGPVNIVKCLIIVFGCRVKYQMVLDEDCETMSHMARGELTVLDEGGKVQATPSRESLEDLL